MQSVWLLLNAAGVSGTGQSCVGDNATELNGWTSPQMLHTAIALALCAYRG
ncbi:MAG: hypothetical protein JWM19_6963 [Actinomycetia bacterium]|nr:hypothetical protein [Actinomycetes bacterium]